MKCLSGKHIVPHYPKAQISLKNIDARYLNFLKYITLALITLYCFGSILTSHQIQTHETAALYFRISEYLLEIRDYGFPPVLFPSIIQTGGFAFPSLYPPLSYYFTTLIAALIKNIVLSVHISLFLSVLLSGWSMFYNFKKIFKPHTAFLAATAYLVFPYRFIDTHVRGAMAESWTFVWYPFIFTACMLMIKKQFKYSIPVLIISLAGLLLTHSVMAIHFIGLTAIFFAVMVVKFRAWKLIPITTGCGIVSLGLCAWFILPQTAMLGNLKVSDPESMAATLDCVVRSAPDFSQLFYSNHDRWGIHTVKSDYKNHIFTNFMSFELGIPYVLSLLAFFGYLVFPGNKDKSVYTLPLITLSLAVLIIVLWYIAFPRPLGSLLPSQLMYIQFSWRLLGITLFFACVLLAACIDDFVLGEKAKLQLITLGIIAFIGTINPLFKCVFYIEDPVAITDREAIIPYANKGLVEKAEYVPRDWDTDKCLLFLSGRKIEVTGQANYQWLDKEQETRSFTVNAQTTSTAKIPLTYYPVWKITNQDNIPMRQESIHGLIQIEIPPGDHTISIERIAPPRRIFGSWISGFAFVILLGVSLTLNLRGRLKSTTE